MKKQQAYTLIELLIALFIFAILASIVMGGIYSILNLRESHLEHAQRLGQLQKTLLIMERDIEQMVDRQIRNPRGTYDEPFQFEKNANETIIEFTRTGFINPQGREKRSGQ